MHELLIVVQNVRIRYICNNSVQSLLCYMSYKLSTWHVTRPGHLMFHINRNERLGLLCNGKILSGVHLCEILLTPLFRVIEFPIGTSCIPLLVNLCAHED